MNSSDSNIKYSEEEAHVVKKSEYMQIEILFEETTNLARSEDGF